MHIATSVIVLWLSSPVAAHIEGAVVPDNLWRSWNLDPWLLLTFALVIAQYGVGLRALWRRAGSGRGVSHLQAYSFGVGMLLLFIALISPLDQLAASLAAAHMVQHLALLFAAPFLVLAAPLPVFLWSLPLSWRRGMRDGSKQRYIAQPWHLFTAPVFAWLLHAVTLWAWHAPVLYVAALQNSLIHDLEHISFLGASLLFWWTVLRKTANSMIALLMIISTMLHSGLLAALMSFTSAAWYVTYAGRTVAWGLSPLEDQQLAGLIMWVPGSLAYLAVVLILVSSFLQRPHRAGTARFTPI